MMAGQPKPLLVIRICSITTLGDLDSVFGHGASATLADGLQLAGNHIFFLAEKKGVLNAISPACEKLTLTATLEPAIQLCPRRYARLPS